MSGPATCPPCKIIICGGGIAAPIARMQILLENAAALVNPSNAFNYDHGAVSEVIAVMEQLEDEMNECAEKFEKAVKKLGRVPV
jgi:hypothetical protein